ncbi:WD40/YVTN/BNR-like repeat-containing protein [Aromatoleum diolicum]|uniref:Glycosyl hydrolase n=1 Tax=Aromatoleum diolicum TaxID=75796 RepID=A0ABX1QCI3_9RHOO|nr:YCF48-related protein [Aromatoleum diolicum]NMG74726.1 glycosyl hydrolase [Aromatoleum diolicum]
MLKAINGLGKAARSGVALTTSAAPMLIIGALLYTAFFVKAEPQVGNLQARSIERRDAFYGVAVPQADVVWAAGSYGKVVRSDNAGKSWGVQPTPGDAHLQAISAWDAERAVAVGNHGVVIVTADGGKSWREIEVPHSEVANKLMQVRSYAGGTGWAVGEMGAVLRTRDYGASWTRVLDEKDQAWNDIFFVGEDGWMVGEFGRMMRTRDGGESWSTIDSPLESSLMSVHFRDASNGVAVGLAGAVLVTADGGAVWTEARRVTREHLNCVIWDGSRWVAVGDKGIRVTAGADGSGWTGGRISEQDLSWRTQIARAGDGFVLAGANLAQLEHDQLHIIGRD